MFYIGVDLSGPGNKEETVLVVFESSGKGGVSARRKLFGADDYDILNSVGGLLPEGDIVVGLDAPLSYNIGGGDRPGDADLRKKIVAAGLKPGSVMPPTLTRMAYLTLRGISVARLLLSADPGIGIVEVHPGAAMALRGAPVSDVTAFKNSVASRRHLLAWLARQGLEDILDVSNPSDHYVAACACGLACWRWHRNRSAWIHRREPPFHPFDYAC